MSAISDLDECPQPLLAAAILQIQNDETQGLAEVENLLGQYRRDPRLHFLQGSLFAGLRRYDDARKAMGKAVDLAPGFHIARFQLGFLEYTSGNLALAAAIWGPLSSQAPDHPLRLFAEGLGHLAQNDSATAVASLRKGITLNDENLPLNRDIQMIIDELLTPPTPPEEDDGVSSTHHLLQQYVSGKTRH